MKQKLLIYFGIVLLILGIFLRVMHYADVLGLVLILMGVALKASYIILKIISREYQIGYEISFLIIGLPLFFYSKIIEWDYSNLLMGIGIALKVIFVILFIRKVRK